MNIREKYTVVADTYRTPTQKEGTWNQLMVSVFLNKEDGSSTKIGSYIRSYGTMYNTWEPFEQDGKEYALCSPDYWRTSVMALPSCEIIATEDLTYTDEKTGEKKNGSSAGFCPRDFFVLGRHDEPMDDEDDNGFTIYDGNIDENNDYNPSGSVEKNNEVLGKFGFVAGCMWGDDHSDKIQFLDLSRISEGIITRDDRFGYLELPARLSLKESLEISLESGGLQISILAKKSYTQYGGLDKDKLKSY
jgi:hypothetical protein